MKNFWALPSIISLVSSISVIFEKIKKICLLFIEQVEVNTVTTTMATDHKLLHTNHANLEDVPT
jgi:hypothetical protein